MARLTRLDGLPVGSIVRDSVAAGADRTEVHVPLTVGMTLIVALAGHASLAR